MKCGCGCRCCRSVWILEPCLGIIICCGMVLMIWWVSVWHWRRSKFNENARIELILMFTPRHWNFNLPRSYVDWMMLVKIIIIAMRSTTCWRAICVTTGQKWSCRRFGSRNYIGTSRWHVRLAWGTRDGLCGWKSSTANCWMTQWTDWRCLRVLIRQNI